MRVLVAGGVFRLDEATRAARQPTPEMVLATGLTDRGVEVEIAPLERIAHIATARRPDLVHVHHLSKAAVGACMLPRHQPVVFSAHSTDRPTRRLHRLGLDVVSRRMDGLVCLSEPEEQDLLQRFPRVRGRTRVIPNGLDLPDGAALRLPPDDGAFTVLFVGQLIGIKRVDRIIRALVDRPRLRLRVVFHTDLLEPELTALADSLGVRDRVEFVGRRSGEQLYAEYRQAHLLALPSTTEALPSVLIEALATGLPIVASRTGGTAGQVDGAGVLTDPRDDGSFARGLDRLLADYPSYAETAHRAAGSVAARYSVEAMISGHLDLYHSLLTGS